MSATRSRPQHVPAPGAPICRRSACAIRPGSSAGGLVDSPSEVLVGGHLFDRVVLLPALVTPGLQDGPAEPGSRLPCVRQGLFLRRLGGRSAPKDRHTARLRPRVSSRVSSRETPSTERTLTGVPDAGALRPSVLSCRRPTRCFTVNEASYQSGYQPAGSAPRPAGGSQVAALHRAPTGRKASQCVRTSLCRRCRWCCL
jgi:hypothetical protein